jgi:putative transport protein
MIDWINGLFVEHSSIQAVVVLSLIISVGLWLGSIKFRGLSLGIAFVFFAGILAGHFGLEIDSTVTGYAETFGLALFVYTLGLHIGPNFFGLMKHEGVSLNLWSLALVVLGTVLAVVLIPLTGTSLPDMVGLLCGATTNTPALGAATQSLGSLGLPSGSVALATAVTYPLGVVCVIFVMMLLRRFCVKNDDLKPRSKSDDDHTYIAEFDVVNPAVEGRTIAEIAHDSHLHFIISRIWRGEQVILPKAQTRLQANDKMLVVTTRDDERALELLFGVEDQKDWNREKIDWNAIDAQLESRVIVLTRAVLNGKILGKLRLRDTYGVNVSRVIRGDVKLLATDDLRLQYGDRITVVGEHEAVDNVESFLGNAVKTLEEPNIGSIFLGIILGLAVGAIPIAIPGMQTPVHLGVAGGAIIVGILVGALGPRLHFISYTTRSASLMLRKLGLSMYLACIGIVAGRGFFATVFRPEGLMWVGIGAVLTMLPCIIIGVLALKSKKFDFATVCGIICGAMANPMALGYANDTLEGDNASVSYASVYPLGMFVRVLIAQLLIMFAMS